MDTKEFFRQMTVRLCGHLEIEQGLRACIEYLGQYMPADFIVLDRYDRTMGAMHLIARATQEKGELIDTPVPLDQAANEEFARLIAVFQRGELPDVLMVNNPSEEPITNSFLKVLGEPVCSALILSLALEDKHTGFFAMFARGRDRYNQEDAALFATIKEPFFVAMSNAIKHRQVLKLRDMLADDNRYLHGELRRLSGDEIIGAHYGLKEVMFKANQVASLDSPVLLLGETGVGKDIIANAIHYSSHRSDGPFVTVNCGAIPDTLIDSELFGHEKGAFTGAMSQKRGRFERANSGTIFLDEVGELSPQVQVRLLRVLQNKEIERVGGVRTIPLDIRVIAATNKDLESMVRNQKFRDDLWYRLNVFPILIPPLRKRKSDIPALVNHFISAKSRELKLPSIPVLKAGAIEPLMEYHWPGNVRELQNVIERALILNPLGPLTFENLGLPRKLTYDQANGEGKDDADKLDVVIARHIKTVLSRTHGKVHGTRGAAEVLGVNASTLRHRMQKLGIDYKKSSQT